MKQGFDGQAIVILNYLTVEDTREAIDSLLLFYPGARLLVVDNGSPGDDFSELMKEYRYPVTCLCLSKNLGFAGGLNEGISLLRREGYDTIICCSNDIVFLEGKSLHALIRALSADNVAVAGPAVITPKGKSQSPLLRKRPDCLEAEKMVRYYDRRRIISRLVLNRFLLSPLKKTFRRARKPEDLDFSKMETATEASEDVYAINGAIFALGPRFFSHYDRLDPHTFLFGEELILGEMVFKAGLKTVYIPDSIVFHKEDRTSNMVWGSEDRLEPALIAAKSIRHWHQEHYLEG